MAIYTIDTCGIQKTHGRELLNIYSAKQDFNALCYCSKISTFSLSSIETPKLFPTLNNVIRTSESSMVSDCFESSVIPICF